MYDRNKYFEDKLAVEIDAWDLNVVLMSGERIIVIDARAVDAYTKEHIPDAIDIPHRECPQNPRNTSTDPRLSSPIVTASAAMPRPRVR